MNKRNLTGRFTLGFVAAAFLSAGCSAPIEKVWEFSTLAPIYSNPAVTDKLIIFGNEAGNVYAVDKKGAYRWKFPTLKEVIAAPKVQGDKIFFGSTNYIFYCLDLNGMEKWKYPTRDRIKSDPLVLDDTVYFSSYDDRVYAVRHADKDLRWKFPPDEWPEDTAEEDRIQPDDFSYSSPVSDGEAIYLGNLDGYVYAIWIKDQADEEGNVTAKAGTLKWRFATGDGVTSTALVKDGVVYFGSNDGYIYAIQAATAEQLWKFKTDGQVNASPIMSDGVIFIGSNDKKFYALDKSGKELWSFTTLGGIISSAAIYQNLVLFGGGTGDHHLYALDKASGELFWKHATGYKIESDPVIDGNMVYVTSGDRKLYAFRINRTTK